MTSAVRRITSAVQDISERKRQEEERNANLLQMALDATQEAVWEWDLETGQAWFIPEYYTMLGYLPDEFPSNQQEWRYRPAPDHNHALHEQIVALAPTSMVASRSTTCMDMTPATRCCAWPPSACWPVRAPSILRCASAATSSR